MHFFYANITTYCLHISGNAMEGQCDVALLSPGTWDDTGCISPVDCSSLAYTDADLTRRVHDGTYQLFLGMHELDPAALRANMTVRNGQVQPSNTK